MKHLLVGFVAGAFLVAAAVIVKIPYLVGVTGSEETVSINGEGSSNNAPQAAHTSAVAVPPASNTETASSPSNAKTDDRPHPYRIVINIPAYKLRLYENDRVIKTYTVCVGMPGYRTPVRKMTLNRVIWNPSWAPPPNAAWARGSSAKGPGKMNPVGVVKMPIKGYVYIHGTYKIKSLGFAWSHGCIRMANDDAVELAWFLQSHVGSNHPDHTLDTYLVDKRTRMIFLKHPVPVETIYETLEVDNERLLIHPDVYRFGLNSPQRVMEKIANIGWGGKALNEEYISQLLQRSRIETAITTRSELFGEVNSGNTVVQ